MPASQEKPEKQRVVLTQKMVDELREYVAKTPQDEKAKLRLIAMEQGLVKVGHVLPPGGMYPMPAQGPLELGPEATEKQKVRSEIIGLQEKALAERDPVKASAYLAEASMLAKREDERREA